MAIVRVTRANLATVRIDWPSPTLRLRLRAENQERKFMEILAGCPCTLKRVPPQQVCVEG